MASECCNVEHSQDQMKETKSLEPYDCCGCKKPAFGQQYVCENCNFTLHEACLFTKKTTSHEFFPDSTFEFFETPPYPGTFCDACIMPINGFSYHCQNQNLNLHPNCMELKKNFKIKVMDFDFNLHKEVRVECTYCKKKSINGSDHDNNGWFYVSKCGRFQVHVACTVPLFTEIHRRLKQANRDRVTDSASTSASASGKAEFESNYEDINLSLFTQELFKQWGWSWLFE